MAEWLYEAGIGENRAALVDDGTIVEALIERHDGGPRVGAVVQARLTEIALAGRRGIAATDDGNELFVEPLGTGLTQGALFLAEITREAIPEPGCAKRARARGVPAGSVVTPGPGLRDRIGGTGIAVVELRSHEREDRLEAAGWSELIEEATTGEIVFDGGALRISLTPAMTLIDVDGPGDATALAIAGAAAAAQTIRRLGLAGSIGIDLPTVGDKAVRNATAAAFDALLPQPFERTAVNGFGFMQVVRRRERASLSEMWQYQPVASAALALLRRAERSQGTGPATLIVRSPVAGYLEARPGLIEELGRHLGRTVAIKRDDTLELQAGHAE